MFDGQRRVFWLALRVIEPCGQENFVITPSVLRLLEWETLNQGKSTLRDGPSDRSEASDVSASVRAWDTSFLGISFQPIFKLTDDLSCT
jgi:hypothetical protein